MRPSDFHVVFDRMVCVCVCVCVCVLLCYPLPQWLTDCDPKARPGPHLFFFFLTFILCGTTVDLQCCVSFRGVCVCYSLSRVQLFENP